MLPNEPFPILTLPMISIFNAFSEEPSTPIFVIGESGVGKTYTVTEAIQRLPLREIRAVAQTGMTARQLANTLLHSATRGSATRPSAQLGEKTTLSPDELVSIVLDETFHDKPIVVIDDAHLLSAEAIGWVCQLCERPKLRVAVLGDTSIVESLSRRLCRSTRLIWIEPLHPNIVAEVLEYFHPIYNEASGHTIELIDTSYAHGNFARWAAFTRHAAKVCVLDDVPFLTYPAAEIVLDHLGPRDAAA